MKPLRLTHNGTSPAVVVDGSHFFNATGTGIASYARGLVSSLRAAGCSVSVLYGRPIASKAVASSLDLASQVFGTSPEPRRIERALRLASVAFRARFGFCGRATAELISTHGIDMKAIEPPLPEADIVLNTPSLYERADIVFRMSSRFTELSLPPGIAAAHWTSPIPVRAKGVPNIYTLHDLIPLQFPYFVIDKGGRGARLHAKIAEQADLIVTVSEASKRHIVELLNVAPDNVHVTYQSCPSLSQMPREFAERLVRDVYGVKPDGYALFLGALEPKKNVRRLMEAFLLANINMPLLIAGPLGWLYDKDLDLIETIGRNALPLSTGEDDQVALLRRALLPGMGSPIRRLGYLPRSHATALLQCARFFTFPSIYEGFGLPVLESMQLGVPVLTSNTSSLPEVAGDAAVQVNPFSINELTEGIRSLASDGDLRGELVRRGHIQASKFGPEIYKMRLGEAYQKVGVEMSAFAKV